MDRSVHTVFNVLVLGLSIACMLYGRTFQYPTSAYMLGVFGLLAASCAFNLLVIARDKRAGAGTSGSTQETKPFIERKAALAIALILAYAAATPVVGFYATSLVYFVVWVMLFGLRRGRAELCTALGVAVASIVIVYVLFSYMLGVPAPEGILL